MIDFIEGTIEYIDSEYVVILACGVGYRLFCPNPYRFVQAEGKTNRLYTHHHVREDAMLLYGFPTREERDLFRRLLDVSGIGPKGALAILAAANPEQIVLAIQQENVALLTSFPGIGKKTAQRIILDLKDKVTHFLPPSAANIAEAAAAVSGPLDQVMNDTFEALKALGYAEAELLKIKPMLVAEAEAGAAVEQLIKRGLFLLSRG